MDVDRRSPLEKKLYNQGENGCLSTSEPNRKIELDYIKSSLGTVAICRVHAKSEKLQ